MASNKNLKVARNILKANPSEDMLANLLDEKDRGIAEKTYARAITEQKITRELKNKKAIDLLNEWKQWKSDQMWNKKKK